MNDELHKLLEEWRYLYSRCVAVYTKRPNEFLDGFMSSLTIRINDLERILNKYAEE